MQKKENAPCNNQLNRTKRKEDKKKVTFYQENCLSKSASGRTRNNRIPQVPPKEQEAAKSPTPLLKPMNSSPLLKPIHSK
jgi:hypothetical protein